MNMRANRSDHAGACFLAGAAITSLWIYTFQKGWVRELPGCSQGSACDAVLVSSWADWVRQPLSSIGLAVYGGLASGSLLSRRLVWLTPTVLAAPALTVLFVSVWLVALQFMCVGSLCVPCLAVLSLGLFGSAMLLPAWWRGERLALRIKIILYALLVAALFVVAHFRLNPASVLIPSI